MGVKFPPRDLNPDSCPPHPTITYTTYFITVTKNKKILIWDMNYAILNIGSTVAKFKNRNR